MANMHLVTGYAGQEHVTAADQGAFNLALLGVNQFVLGKGSKLSAAVQTNNSVRVSDGDIYMQGRYIRLNEGTYVDLVIENGEQGKNRNDLIVARYTKDAQTAVEEVNLVVIKGTSATGAATDPAYTSGDLIGDHDALNDMPLYRVPLSGLNVGTLVPLFTVVDDTMLDKLGSIGDLATESALADGDYFPIWDSSASANKKVLFSRIKALIDAVPTSRKVNNNPLSADVTLDAADVGAVPTTRTVNGKALSANVALTASDVGAMGTFTRSDADVNTYVESGCYAVNGANPNLPTGGAYSNLIVARNGSTCFQFLVAHSSALAYYRGGAYRTNVWDWQPWSKIVNAGNFSLSGTTLTITI